MRTAFPLLAGLLFFACSENKVAEPPARVKGASLVTLPLNPNRVKGTYFGDFKGSPLALTLNYVGHRRVSGYNVHKGLLRNVNGTIETTPAGLRLDLKEPGNNPFDGSFALLIDTATWSGTGTWRPAKGGAETQFRFQRKAAPAEQGQYGQTFVDSLQNSLQLKPDGSCSYTYLTDTTATGQERTIRGNYTLNNKTLTIYWQKNNLFPAKSVFAVLEQKPYPGEEYIEKSLKGEGKLFTQLWD